MKNDPLVQCRGVKFSYEKGKKATNILDNANMSVSTGEIYALLGPSGCGKTTLLKLITGSLTLKRGSGEILVFGQYPLSKSSLIPGPSVGFMPQELSLNTELTTLETLHLFGRLNGLKQPQLSIKIEELCKTLDLSLKKKLIEELSGGQQRRVSLATALLHEPPLLILDEPTVGVDPLLRKQIWSYLVKLTRTSNTTIIITTHYIDEAKDANTIGAMRYGRVLVEASPSQIMTHFKENNLESCFLKICSLDSSNEQIGILSAHNSSQREVVTPVEDKTNFQFLDDNGYPVNITKTPPRTPSLIKRNLILCNRNFTIMGRRIPILAFQCILPVTQIVLLCLCIGYGLFDLPISVVNDEASQGWGNTFVKHLDRHIVKDKTFKLEDALDSVRRGESVVALHVQENFTTCLNNKFRLGLDADNETVLCSSVSAYFDMTKKPAFIELYRSFLQTYQSFMEEVLVSLGKSPLLAKWPIEIVDPVYGSPNAKNDQFVIPGAIVLLAHFMAAGVTGLKLILERKSGTEEKLWISGVTKTDLLLSYFATELATVIIQVVLVLVCTFYIFQLPLLGSIFTLGGIAVCQGLTGMALGFFLSCFLDEHFGTYILVGWMFANLFTGAIVWPANAQPRILREVFYYMPVTMPTEAIKAIMSKGWGMQHLTVVLGFVSSFAYGILFTGIAIIKLKYFS